MSKTANKLKLIDKYDVQLQLNKLVSKYLIANKINIIQYSLRPLNRQYCIDVVKNLLRIEKPIYCDENKFEQNLHFARKLIENNVRDQKSFENDDEIEFLFVHIYFLVDFYARCDCNLVNDFAIQENKKSKFLNVVRDEIWTLANSFLILTYFESLIYNPDDLWENKSENNFFLNRSKIQKKLINVPAAVLEEFYENFLTALSLITSSMENEDEVCFPCSFIDNIIYLSFKKFGEKFHLLMHFSHSGKIFKTTKQILEQISIQNVEKNNKLISLLTNLHNNSDPYTIHLPSNNCHFIEKYFIKMSINIKKHNKDINELIAIIDYEQQFDINSVIFNELIESDREILQSNIKSNWKIGGFSPYVEYNSNFPLAPYRSDIKDRTKKIIDKAIINPDFEGVNYFPITPEFMGRREEIDQIEKFFLNKNNNVVIKITYITGMIGFGKSSLAKQYAREHANDYELIWYFNADKLDSLDTAYSEFATFLSKIKFSMESFPEKADEQRVWIREKINTKINSWLLIFDDIDLNNNIIELNNYFPSINCATTQQAHIIITGCNTNTIQQYDFCKQNTFILSLEPIDIDSAIKLILNISNSEDSNNNVRRLANELSCCPFVIDALKSTIKLGIDVALNEVEGLIHKTPKEKDPILKDEKLLKILDMIYAKINHESKLAIFLLKIISYLDKNIISLYFLSILKYKNIQLINKKLKLQNALLVLEKYNFIKKIKAKNDLYKTFHIAQHFLRARNIHDFQISAKTIIEVSQKCFKEMLYKYNKSERDIVFKELIKHLSEISIFIERRKLTIDYISGFICFKLLALIYDALKDNKNAIEKRKKALDIILCCFKQSKDLLFEEKVILRIHAVLEKLLRNYLLENNLSMARFMNEHLQNFNTKFFNIYFLNFPGKTIKLYERFANADKILENFDSQRENLNKACEKIEQAFNEENTDKIKTNYIAKVYANQASYCMRFDMIDEARLKFKAAIDLLKSIPQEKIKFSELNLLEIIQGNYALFEEICGRVDVAKEQWNNCNNRELSLEYISFLIRHENFSMALQLLNKKNNYFLSGLLIYANSFDSRLVEDLKPFWVDAKMIRLRANLYKFYLLIKIYINNQYKSADKVSEYLTLLEKAVIEVNTSDAYRLLNAAYSLVNLQDTHNINKKINELYQRELNQQYKEEDVAVKNKVIEVTELMKTLPLDKPSVSKSNIPTTKSDHRVNIDRNKQSKISLQTLKNILSTGNNPVLFNVHIEQFNAKKAEFTGQVDRVNMQLRASVEKEESHANKNSIIKGEDSMPNEKKGWIVNDVMLQAVLARHMQEDGDETLASQAGSRRDYHYSLTDGFMLVSAIRQHTLIYQDEAGSEYSRPGGEEFSSYRENRAGIYLSNPYYISLFEESFLDDVNKLISGSFTWSKAPTRLVLPVLCGEHWCCLRVMIDKTNSQLVSLLWDDPYGIKESFEAYQGYIIPALSKGLSLLTGVTIDEEALLSQVVYKPFDQQGYFPGFSEHNGYDCGPIIFSNIESYVTHNEKPNTSFIDLAGEYHYAIPLFLNESFKGMSHHECVETRRTLDRLSVCQANPFKFSQEEKQKRSVAASKLPTWVEEYKKLPGSQAVNLFEECITQANIDDEAIERFVNASKATESKRIVWESNDYPFRRYQTLVNYYKALKDKDEKERLRIGNLLLEHLSNTARSDASLMDLASLVSCQDKDITNSLFDIYKKFLSEKEDLGWVYKAITVTCEKMQLEWVVDENSFLPEKEVLISQIKQIAGKILEVQLNLGAANSASVLLGLGAMNSLIDCLLLYKKKEMGERAYEELKAAIENVKKNIEPHKIGFPRHYFLSCRAVEGLQAIPTQRTVSEDEAKQEKAREAKKQSTKAATEAVKYGVEGTVALAAGIATAVGTAGAAAPIIIPAVVACVGGWHQSYRSYKEHKSYKALAKHFLQKEEVIALDTISSVTRQKCMVPPDYWRKIIECFLTSDNRLQKPWKDIEAMRVIYYLSELVKGLEEVPEGVIKAIKLVFTLIYQQNYAYPYVQSFVLENFHLLNLAGHTHFAALDEKNYQDLLIEQVKVSTQGSNQTSIEEKACYVYLEKNKEKPQYPCYVLAYKKSQWLLTYHDGQSKEGITVNINLVDGLENLLANIPSSKKKKEPKLTDISQVESIILSYHRTNTFRQHLQVILTSFSAESQSEPKQYHEALNKSWFGAFPNDNLIYNAWQQYRAYVEDESNLKLLQSMNTLISNALANASNVEFTSHWASQVWQLLSNTIELIIKEKEMKNEEGDMKKGNQKIGPDVTVDKANKVHYGNAYIETQHVEATAENALVVATAVDFLTANKEKRKQERPTNEEKKRTEPSPARVHFKEVDSFQDGDLYDGSVHFKEIKTQAVLATKHNSPVFTNQQAATQKDNCNSQLAKQPITYRKLEDDEGEYFQVTINYDELNDEIAKNLQSILEGECGKKLSSCTEPPKTRLRGKGYIQQLDFTKEHLAKKLCEVANQFIEAEQTKEHQSQAENRKLSMGGK